jgi:hypothetical protein
MGGAGWRRLGCGLLRYVPVRTFPTSSMRRDELNGPTQSARPSHYLISHHPIIDQSNPRIAPSMATNPGTPSIRHAKEGRYLLIIAAPTLIPSPS